MRKGLWLEVYLTVGLRDLAEKRNEVVRRKWGLSNIWQALWGVCLSIGFASFHVVLRLQRYGERKKKAFNKR